MKIAIDSQIFAQQRFGGISRYFCEIPGELESLGVETRIFASIHQNLLLKELPSRFRPNARYSPALLSSGCKLASHWNGLMGYFSMKAWAPDIVHESYYRRRDYAPRGVPRVLTVYDMIHELYSSTLDPHGRMAQIKRFAVQRADHVVCISHSTKNDLLATIDIDEKKVSVIHLGLNPSGMTAKSDDQAAVGERPFILYVGQRPHYKNFALLLEAFSRTTTAQHSFDLIAFGGGTFTLQETELIERLGLGSGKIRHMGGGDEQLCGAFAKARAFIYPSAYEGFGIPPLEAMVNGCPVIASNTSSMPEVIDTAGVLFDPSQRDELVSLLDSVLFDDSLLEELSRRGREQYKKFTWAACAVQHADLYARLLA